jgi:hypothetical protein
MDGHRDRQSLLRKGVIQESTGSDGCYLTEHSVASDSAQGLIQESTPSDLGEHTIQGLLPGSERDFDGDAVAASPSGKSEEPGDSLVETPSGPSVDELRGMFLSYMREHATGSETGLRPSSVWQALGFDPFGQPVYDASVEVIGSLRAEGLIRPCQRGWYAPALVIAS